MLKVRQRIRQRRLAVVESIPGVSKTYVSQLIMATEAEFKMYQTTFPGLTIRWAKDEDKAKWRYTEELFNQKPIAEEYGR